MDTDHTPAPDETHDVVVVGARCAGAATALLLARQGHDVLVLDRATSRATRCRPTPSPAAASCSCPAGACSTRSSPAAPRRSATCRFHPPDGRDRSGAVKDRAGVDHLVAPRRYVLDALLAEAAACRPAPPLLTGAHGHRRRCRRRGRVDRGRPAATATGRTAIDAPGSWSAPTVSARGSPGRSGADVIDERPAERRPAGTPTSPASTPGGFEFHVGARRVRRRLPHPRRRGQRLGAATPRPAPGRSGRGRPAALRSAARPGGAPSLARGCGAAAIDVAASAAPPGCPTTCCQAGRARAGRWSATPATTATRSPATASPTPSATPSCWPTPLDAALRGAVPRPRPWPRYERRARRGHARRSSTSPARWRVPAARPSSSTLQRQLSRAHRRRGRLARRAARRSRRAPIARPRPDPPHHTNDTAPHERTTTMTTTTRTTSATASTPPPCSPPSTRCATQPEAAKFQFRATNRVGVRHPQPEHDRRLLRRRRGARPTSAVHLRRRPPDRARRAATTARRRSSTCCTRSPRCLTAGLANIAAARGVDADRGHAPPSRATSTCNGILGLDPTVRNGFERHPGALRRRRATPRPRSCGSSSSSRGPAPPCSTSSPTRSRSPSRSRPADGCAGDRPAGHRPSGVPMTRSPLQLHDARTSRAGPAPISSRPRRRRSGHAAVARRHRSLRPRHRRHRGPQPTFRRSSAGSPAPLIYSGSAQVAVIGLLDDGAAPSSWSSPPSSPSTSASSSTPPTMARYWRGTSHGGSALAAYRSSIRRSPSASRLRRARRPPRPPPLPRRRRPPLGGLAGRHHRRRHGGAGLPAALHLELVVPLFLVGEVAHASPTAPPAVPPPSPPAWRWSPSAPPSRLRTARRHGRRHRRPLPQEQGRPGRGDHRHAGGDGGGMAGGPAGGPDADLSARKSGMRSWRGGKSGTRWRRRQWRSARRPRGGRRRPCRSGGPAVVAAGALVAVDPDGEGRVDQEVGGEGAPPAGRPLPVQRHDGGVEDEANR